MTARPVFIGPIISQPKRIINSVQNQIADMWLGRLVFGCDRPSIKETSADFAA